MALTPPLFVILEKFQKERAIMKKENIIALCGDLDRIGFGLDG